MDLGQPKELNVLESFLVILAVCVMLSCVSHAYPEYLSTVARTSFLTRQIGP